MLSVPSFHLRVHSLLLSNNELFHFLSHLSVIHSPLLSDWMLRFAFIHALAQHSPFLHTFSLILPLCISLLRQVRDRALPLERSLYHLLIIIPDDG